MRTARALLEDMAPGKLTRPLRPAPEPAVATVATVAVFETHETKRLGLKVMLEAAGLVVAAAERDPSSLPECDVVVTGSCCGPDVVDRIRLATGAQILVLLSSREDDAVSKPTADGYALEDHLDSASLARTISAMLDGTFTMPAVLARKMVRPGERSLRLTAREREVLALVAGGHTNRQIARVLAIGENTVKRHVATLMAKLQAPNRTLAAARAIRDGLL